MTIEILYFEGCPNHERLLGSPTLRVNGHDVEPAADEPTDYGMKCRIYRTPEGLTGLPADRWILAALTTP